MSTLRNRRKLAAVSGKTHENTRNRQSQNALDPEMAREYISYVFEEIEGKVTKKFSKEFSRMESRILSALSKLNDFPLNPQVRTSSVAVPGTTRNSNSGNRHLNGDLSPNDPCPEARISFHHSSNLISSEVEEYPHSVLMRIGFALLAQKNYYQFSWSSSLWLELGVPSLKGTSLKKSLKVLRKSL